MFATKDGAPLAAVKVKVDTYVLETDVHFPTDLNLLWDAGRKCVDLIVKYRDRLGYALPGWRKAKAWRRQLKRCERSASQAEGNQTGRDISESSPRTCDPHPRADSGRWGNAHPSPARRCPP